jgi:7,8-dihydroneopterin aldolase/epimerase/oxygenase
VAISGSRAKGKRESFMASQLTELGTDMLRLEVRDVEVMILTGIYSEETKLPQPLRISVAADMAAGDRFEPDTPLSRSKNYMDIKHAMTDALPKDQHFTLIEAVADHIADTIFLQDRRILRVAIEIVKLAISENGEEIGITMVRNKR